MQPHSDLPRLLGLQRALHMARHKLLDACSACAAHGTEAVL
jgi:hypothetical protein